MSRGRLAGGMKMKRSLSNDIIVRLESQRQFADDRIESAIQLRKHGESRVLKSTVDTLRACISSLSDMSDEAASAEDMQIWAHRRSIEMRTQSCGLLNQSESGLIDAFALANFEGKAKAYLLIAVVIEQSLRSRGRFRSGAGLREGGRSDWHRRIHSGPNWGLNPDGALYPVVCRISDIA